MKNFWERISFVYTLPSSFNFILNEDIDIYSSIVAEVTFLMRNNYVTLEKDKLKIISQNIYNLSKTQQYLMRIIANELDFNEKIFKALILEDGKIRNIILKDFVITTNKILICFIPALIAIFVLNLIDIISNLDLNFDLKNLFTIIKILTCISFVFIYKDTVKRFQNINSKKFILTKASLKDKHELIKYLQKNASVPNTYLNIFLADNNKDNILVKLIK